LDLGEEIYIHFVVLADLRVRKLDSKTFSWRSRLWRPSVNPLVSSEKRNSGGGGVEMMGFG
jgi:hypothetical protein